ncbi:hypothetical protein [Reyranella soli]|uniref:Uncharacterized protein n=1 Tax=Reyranella soli TaxID=1230389 RepID=A0A512NB49_9HYPH|nr:hypothetical protein [Reyranella soli]GEP56176.1 hypothetical protein RSO01_33420 [Reyranella soli]
MSAKVIAVAVTAVVMAAATAVVTAAEPEAGTAAVLAEPVQAPAVVLVPEAAELDLVAPGVAVPEVAARELELLVVPVREELELVPELVAPEVAVPEAGVAEVEQPAGPAEAVRVAAAQAVPLRPAQAMAQRVPAWVLAAVETEALARRVQSVPLPVLPAWALPQAVAHPTGRRRMGRPRGRMARSRGLGGGRGPTSWRPLPVRKRPAPTSCVQCTSAATSLRVQQTA